MSKFSIQTEQIFNVTYEIDADSPSEAWELLTAANTPPGSYPAELNCEPSAVSWYLTLIDAQSSKIIATMEESAIEELPV
jgi:hypothetical protein